MTVVRHRLLGYIIFAASAVMPGTSAAAEDSQRADGAIFGQRPESDQTLATVCGGSTGDPRHYRALVEVEMLGYQQQVSRISTLAMDNWWAETGSVLIYNNLLKS